MVDTRGIPKTTEDGKVTCTITNPSGAQTENLVTPLLDGTYKVSYTPFEEGRHTIDIFYDNIPVPGSPFVVTVRRGCDAKKCIAYGPGLEAGILNKSNVFTVDTKGAGTGGLALQIEGPSEAKMTCKDNRDGSCSVEYVPTEIGEYDIGIKFADHHINGSPFKVLVDREVNEKLVKAFGKGLDNKYCRAGVPQTFTIDASKAGPAPIRVNIVSDQNSLPKRPEVVEGPNQQYDVTYVPPNAGANLLCHVTYNGKDIPNSPFPLKVKPVTEPNKVKLTGPVLYDSVPASLPTTVKIDTNEAGFGDLELEVMGPDGKTRPVNIVDNHDGTYNATFVPDDFGRYKLNAKYGQEDVLKQPLPFQAYATGNAEKCKITEGLDKVYSSGESHYITVNTEDAGNGAVTCRIKSVDTG